VQKISFRKQIAYPRSIQAVVSRHHGIAAPKDDEELPEPSNDGPDLLVDSPEWQEIIGKYTPG
jgi:hypothetical protein